MMEWVSYFIGSHLYVEINAYRKSLYAEDAWGYAKKIQKNRMAECRPAIHPPLTGGMMATVSPEDTEVFSLT